MPGGRTLYAAYGSNWNQEQMNNRCPEATVVGVGELPGWRLLFARWADIEPDTAASVPVLLWWLTPGDEASLDGYEGVPTSYLKSPVSVLLNGEVVAAMAYVMAPGARERFGAESGMAPPPEYLERIVTGYRDFGLDAATLYAVATAAN
ncbi:MAG: gamma-glutamylcyclotransferase [Propionibacteriaceae bacterium]|jgi:hypothetical protein|nr:gamma-glutamylcyclotransferase [Propionibacteriaceae bacterium]